MSSRAPIRIVTKRLSRDEVREFQGRPFPGMIKFVVDVERGILALGGEMHVDAETELLEQGSDQEVLWGGNYFPGRGPEGCIEFSSLINIRPSQQNPAMIVLDPDICERMRRIVHDFVGHGEPWE